MESIKFNSLFTSNSTTQPSPRHSRCLSLPSQGPPLSLLGQGFPKGPSASLGNPSEVPGPSRVAGHWQSGLLHSGSKQRGGPGTGPALRRPAGDGRAPAVHFQPTPSPPLLTPRLLVSPRPGPPSLFFPGWPRNRPGRPSPPFSRPGNYHDLPHWAWAISKEPTAYFAYICKI